MTILATLVTGLLIVIAAVHLLWAIGYWWPIKNETALARAVVGTKSVNKMPGAVACSLVTVALLFAASWPWLPPGPMKVAGLVLAALTFQVRAVLAYAPFWKRLTPEMPFRRLDETYYAPLCIFFGLSFMALASQSMR